MRTYDDKLQGASRFHTFSPRLLAASAAITGLLIYLAVNGGRHGHRASTAMIHAILISIGVTVVAYLLTGYASSQISYFADRAFLTRLFMSSGFKRSRAERMAHIKAGKGGGR